MILVGLILAGSLAPILWLHPGPFRREEKAIVEILRRHPDVTINRLEVLSGKPLEDFYREWRTPKEHQRPRALVLDASVPTSRLPTSLIAFRRDLKSDPTLEKTSDVSVEFHLHSGFTGAPASPDPPFDFSIHVAAKQRK